MKQAKQATTQVPASKTWESLTYELAELVMGHPHVTDEERLKIQNQWDRIVAHQAYADKNPGEQQNLRIERLGLLKKVFDLMSGTYYRCIKREPEEGAEIHG